MEFNSLHAQREACEAFITSQKHEGWIVLRDEYDDGGISGGTLNRPALHRLIADIEAGLVDVVVVYKIDRLSRALMDFSRLVEVFDRHGVTFVSVTQQFNTTTSMGRLTLNILLSFAQFEREVTGERIRDKISASRKRGMWTGGNVPLGYRVHDRKLLIEESEAQRVRMIFERFTVLRSTTLLSRELRQAHIKTRRGRLVDKGYLYKLLSNPLYLGKTSHKGVTYPGEHDAIIPNELWERVRAVMKESPRKRAATARSQTPALLKGLLFAPNGRAMTPTHTKKASKLYRYYVTTSVINIGPETCPVRRVPAAEIEGAVVEQLRTIFRQPEIIIGTTKAARQAGGDLSEHDVRKALWEFDQLWNELFPAEQARIVNLLIERVDLTTNGAEIRIRSDGFHNLAAELLPDEPAICH